MFKVRLYDGNVYKYLHEYIYIYITKRLGENICMKIKVTEIPSKFHEEKECLWFVHK